MKTVAKVIYTLVFVSVFPAYAALDFDGCFQLYQPNVMYPVFCLEGTTEEGVGGSGTRLVIFGTNTDRVVHCSKSSGTTMTAQTFEYLLNGQKELSLVGVSQNEGRLSGEAIFGRTVLKFIELDAETSQSLLVKASASTACLSAGW